MSGRADPAATARPYPGLRAFRRDESELFFGRDEQVDQLLDKLAETRFLAVLGTSGSGKSSLVRAGLLPALDSGILLRERSGDGPWPGTRWSIAELRPGEQPFLRLAQALLHDTGWGRVLIERNGGSANPVAALESDLRRGDQALAWLLGIAPLPPGERLLILVDQFEELFRYHRQDSPEAAAFVAMLLGGVLHPDCHLVITLRSEYLGQCAHFDDLPEAINTGLFLIPRLRPTELADAITLPPRLPRFEGEATPSLVTTLLDEAAFDQDRLPLLQHLLMRLWNSTTPGTDGCRVLDNAGLDAIGGPSGALDRDAEQAFNELDQEGQETVEALFRALTELGVAGEPVRRPVRVEDAAAGAGVSISELLAAAAPFRRADRSFLMPPADQSGPHDLGPDDMLDITHEALIRQWQRLRNWTLAESEDAELYRRIESSARRWCQGSGAIWIDPDLQFALDWRDKRRPNPAWAARYGEHFEFAMEFLDQSHTERNRQREEEAERQRRELEQAEEIARYLVALRFAKLINHEFQVLWQQGWREVGSAARTLFISLSEGNKFFLIKRCEESWHNCLDARTSIQEHVFLKLDIRVANVQHAISGLSIGGGQESSCLVAASIGPFEAIQISLNDFIEQSNIVAGCFNQSNGSLSEDNLMTFTRHAIELDRTIDRLISKAGTMIKILIGALEVEFHIDDEETIHG